MSHSSSSSSTTTNYVDDERFDGLYLNVAQTARGIEPLLDTVFSFLRRKTDFLAGPPGTEGDQGTAVAIAKVNEVLQKHVALYRQSQAAAAVSQKRQKQAPTPKTKTKPEPELKHGSTPEEVIELGSDGKFDASLEPSSESSKVPAAAQETAGATTTEPVVSASTPEDGVATTTDGDHRGPPPVGNGGHVPGQYVWTQTLSEVVVTVAVPDGTRGRDLVVTIAPSHLRVAWRSTSNQHPATILDAPLCKTIVGDDSFWTVEDGNRLVLNLQKVNVMEWWDSVCVGDPKIDVRAIQPESSSLGT